MITQIDKIDQLRPSSERDILLVLCQLTDDANTNHYNVIIDFKGYINIQKPSYKDYRYCYKHQQMYRSKGQCQQCVIEKDVELQEYCKFCNYNHVKSTNKERYQCKDCDSICQFTPDDKCLRQHNMKCKNFKPCDYCNKIHNLTRKCLQQIEDDNLYFQKGKMYAEQKSFVTWDIESILDNVQEQELKDKYSMQHTPFIVTWTINAYDKETDTYSQIDHFYDNQLNSAPNGGSGNYIISADDLLLKSIRHMQLIPKKYKVNDFYAHTAAAYDNYLLLAQVIKLDEQFETDQVITNNKLLKLKINTMEFKDSFRIIPLPLAKLNKELALGLEVGKQPQSYTFLTRDIFDYYVQNGGKLNTIKQLVDENILQHKHFDKLSPDEFKQYVIDYGHFDFINQYINYCIQDSFILSKAMQKWSTISLKEQEVNIGNYLTAPSMSMNLFTHNCGTKIQIGHQDLKHNKSKCEYRLSQLVQTNIEMINKLLGTSFIEITNVIYNQKFLDTRYNIDITFNADGKKYGLELDGVFWHGLKELPKSDKYYKIMQERRHRHEDKNSILLLRMDEDDFEDIFHVTDVEFVKFEEVNNIKIDVPPQFNISNRQILSGGRTECFTNYRKIDKRKERMYGIDFTSLYPSAMVFGNLPLRRLIVGTQSGSSIYNKFIKTKDIPKHKFKIDQEYINQLISYANNIPHNITEEQRLEYFLTGSDPDKRLIQIKCQMLPPKELLYPVLGSHICNKLLFPLCRTCAEQKCLNVKNNMKCNHTPEQRMLIDF